MKIATHVNIAKSHAVLAKTELNRAKHWLSERQQELVRSSLAKAVDELEQALLSAREALSSANGPKPTSRRG